MFEQELYKFEVPGEPTQEGDLFHNYEIRSWNLSTRIYQILAVSVVFNLAALGFVGQAELLTTRGCDSPFVGRVCQVLDMAYVGAVLFGTDREYVDAEYERTDLGDAEITYIDVSGVTAPFTYPEGYFYKEPSTDPTAGLIADSGFLAPGIPLNPSQYGSSLIDTPAIAPKNNPNPVNGELPASPFDMGENPTIAKNPKRPRGGRIKGNTNSNVADPDVDVSGNGNTNSSNPTVAKTDPVNPADINKRPFKDVGDLANEKIAKNELDLQTEFVINAKGKLNKDGKFEKNSFKYTVASSPDPDMLDVVQRSIEALNESGYLQYLKDLSGKNLELLVKQDQTSLNAVVQTELESETRARTLSSGLKVLIDFKKSQKNSPTADQNDKDDLLLLENAKVEQVGKKLIITFDVPKEVVHSMIQRKLAELAEEAKKPSGNAMIKANSNTAAK